MTVQHWAFTFRFARRRTRMSLKVPRSKSCMVLSPNSCYILRVSLFITTEGFSKNDQDRNNDASFKTVSFFGPRWTVLSRTLGRTASSKYFATCCTRVLLLIAAPRRSRTALFSIFHVSLFAHTLATCFRYSSTTHHISKKYLS